MESDHSYGIGYRYDAIGRLKTLIHPAQLAPSQNEDEYTYHPNTGALSEVLDRNGNVFTFHYDNLGRPTSVHMPGVVDTMGYDLDGRRTWRRETASAAAGGALLQAETLAYDARGKLLQVNAGATAGRGASTFTQWYSGIGNLVATDWDNLQGLEWAREEFIADPLGNRIKKTTLLPGPQNPGNDHPDYLYRLGPSGRVSEISKVDITTSPAPRDESDFSYDPSGNQERSTQYVEHAVAAITERTRESESRSFYGADERLRGFQEYSISYAGGMGTTTGTWEEYRYDPLGRRVMVISCGVSDGSCEPSVTRFVWSGDQLLWERKMVPGLGTQVEESSGLVSYTHAGGIDRPLAIWKAEVGTIVTHQNWRGQFARGTFGVDQQGPAKIPGQSSDCPSYPPSNGCIPVPWPGWSTTAWHEGFGVANTTGYEHYWMGSLATGMRDASGQLYMRNRYYDPQTGQFTQPDPIGLAGGLNSYGFAAGDPVSYSDPYGLKAEQCPPCRGNENTPQAIEREVATVEARGQNGIGMAAAEGALAVGGAGAALGAANIGAKGFLAVAASPTAVGLMARVGLVGAAATRIASAANSGGGAPLARLERAASAISQLGLRQGAATRLLETTITHMRLERGETVAVGGVNYILSATPGATIRALGVLQNGTVVNARLQSVNGSFQAVP